MVHHPSAPIAQHRDSRERKRGGLAPVASLGAGTVSRLSTVAVYTQPSTAKGHKPEPLGGWPPRPLIGAHRAPTAREGLGRHVSTRPSPPPVQKTRRPRSRQVRATPSRAARETSGASHRQPPRVAVGLAVAVVTGAHAGPSGLAFNQIDNRDGGADVKSARDRTHAGPTKSGLRPKNGRERERLPMVHHPRPSPNTGTAPSASDAV
jgi:hypothetical protein